MADIEQKIDEVEVAEVTEETKNVVNEEDNRPYIRIQRIDPKAPIPEDASDIEGLKIMLSDDGKLLPGMAEVFIADMAVSKIPDKRSILLTTRLRNNMIINTSASSISLEDFNEEALIEECKAKALYKIFDYLKFFWACASVTKTTLSTEMEMMNQAVPQAPVAEEGNADE